MKTSDIRLMIRPTKDLRGSKPGRSMACQDGISGAE
jgi:hypothetical protein